MIKPIILSLAVATALAACSASEKQESPKVGAANPASDSASNKAENPKSKKIKTVGEYSVCHLPDGTVVEEWEYFRQYNK